MPAALVAAYVLVLQSLLGAFALGAGPAAAATDTFGNVICTHDGAAGRPAGNDQDHGQGHRSSCCTLGCAFSASALGPAPDAALHLRTAFAETGAAMAPAPGQPLFSRHRWQANPRAPPAAA